MTKSKIPPKAGNRFILVILLLVSIPAFAQVDTAWVRRYNGPGNMTDVARAIAVDGSGNVYVAGTSGPLGTGENLDYATVKYYPNGDTAWVRRYNGPGNDRDAVRALSVDGSGNVYVTGESEGSGLNLDYATIKYYPNGDTAWVRRYNGPGNSGDQAFGIAVDDSGYVYVTGYSNSDYATIRYYPNGDTVWLRRYNGPGNSSDGANAIAIDNSGNVYVTGSSKGSGTDYDYATIKYYHNGDTAWVRRYNGPANGTDVAAAIAVDNSGNVYVTGNSWGSGSYDYTTIKYYPNGDTAWVRRCNLADNANAIAVDNSGNVYVTGWSHTAQQSNDYLTIKYYPNGDTAWVRRYNASGASNDNPWDIAVDGSGNVYVTGESYVVGTYYDYATIKYCPNGDTAWVIRYNGSADDNDFAYAIAIDGLNNVYVTGASMDNGIDYDYATIKYVQPQPCGDLGFRPNPDGWQFCNCEWNMWPQSWWQQFNYCQYPYPSSWCSQCSPSNFPDWPLWVSAFGEDQCYWDPPPGKVIFKQRAVERWFAKKRATWGGACFGFAVSSLLFFDDYFKIDSVFPGYTQLYSVPINDQSRLLINKYQIYASGKAHLQYVRPFWRSITPNQTLQALKHMFNITPADDRILLLRDKFGNVGHAVVPYKCETDSLNPEITNVYVHDNKYPGYDSLWVSISTNTNTWSYNGRPDWGGPKYLYLGDSLSNYTTNAVIPVSVPPGESGISEKGSMISEYVEFCISRTDTALFQSPAGSIGHIHDSVFTTLSDGFPIPTFTEEETPPTGYYLPNDSWTCQFSGITDSIFRLSLFTDSTVMVYWRADVDSTQNEEVHYAGNDSTLLILNPDTQSRPYNVNIVCSAADSEIYYTINNIPIDHNDSTRFSIKPASELQLDNYGDTKTYDLRIEIAGTNVDTIFFREGIPLDSNSSYLIVPDWRLYHDSLMILVDSGMVGSFSDTIFVHNQGEFIHGDANGDGVINVTDVVYLINYLFIHGPAPVPLAAGDATCDGMVDVSDVVYLINYLFVGGPPPGC